MIYWDSDCTEEVILHTSPNTHALSQRCWLWNELNPLWLKQAAAAETIRLWKVDSLSFFSAESHMVNQISATPAKCLRVYTELWRLTNSLCLNKKDSGWDVCGWRSELQWDCLTRWECMYFCILQMRVRVLCGLCTASFCPLLIAAHFPSLVKEWDDWQWWLHKNSRSIYINENVWKQAEPLIWAKGTVRRERSLTNSASAFWWLMIN